MKVLLVIVSGPLHIQVYREQKEILRKNTHPDVTSIFIESSPGIFTPTQVGDTLYLPGNESFASMTKKTIDSFEYLLRDQSFTHVVRSNLSSMWHLQRLVSYLSSRSPTGVFTGIIGGGSNGQRPFVSGAGMYFTRDIALAAVAYKNEIYKYSFIDDVSISYGLSDVGVELTKGPTRIDIANPEDFKRYKREGLLNDIYHFRCKQEGDRSVEPALMTELLEIFRVDY